jgi:hypothetical protein
VLAWGRHLSEFFRSATTLPGGRVRVIALPEVTYRW